MAMISENIQTLDRMRFELRRLISARLLVGGFVIGDSLRYHQLVAIEAKILHQEGLPTSVTAGRSA